MNRKSIAMIALSALMAVAPLADASANGWDRHGRSHGHVGRDLGILALGVAVVGATVAISNSRSQPASQSYYYPQQAYQQAPAPYYYAPPPRVYYAPAPRTYYAPAPVYYAPQPYYGRPYYRY